MSTDQEEQSSTKTTIRQDTVTPPSDYIELTIEDVAIDTVIDMRAYFHENGMIPTKNIQSYDLFRWLSKQLKKK